VGVEEPKFVRLSHHAIVKAEALGFAPSDLEDAILAEHRRRRRNTGAADWLITVGSFAIAYNHPDRGDELAAFVVTIWRRA